MAFMSGRALFQYNPDLFADDDGAAGDEIFDDSDEETKGPAPQSNAAGNDEDSDGED